MKEKELVAYPYDGFFGAMDTFKDKQQLDDLYESGQAPWEIWKTEGVPAKARPADNAAGGTVSRAAATRPPR
jgi:glucose-1-phosphate cytidylyltransferase